MGLEKTSPLGPPLPVETDVSTLTSPCLGGLRPTEMGSSEPDDDDDDDDDDDEDEDAEAINEFNPEPPPICGISAMTRARRSALLLSLERS